MLITKRLKRNRTSAKTYRSRFAGDADTFPLRQYMRAKDEMFSKVIHALLYFGFFISLSIFSKTTYKLFLKHGTHLPEYAKWASTVFVFLIGVLFLYRCINCIKLIIALRGEMRDYQKQIKT